jgi:glyoxylase-like metal-dependent hydrolase (beta-lactamase superfamily II)
MLHIHSFIFNPVAENTYIVFNDQKQAVIIDPGCYFDNEKEELKDWIEKEKLTVTYLLNTHCHLDHVFGNKYVSETYQLELYCHANEKLLLDYAPASGLNWGMPFDNYQGTINYISETDTILLGEDVLQILFTPGHSPGSLSFYAKEEQFIISGDVLFRESIGRTDLPGADQETLLNSIQTQLFILPDEVIVYSGHGIPTRIGYEKKHNPFL